MWSYKVTENNLTQVLGRIKKFFYHNRKCTSHKFKMFAMGWDKEKEIPLPEHCYCDAVWDGKYHGTIAIEGIPTPEYEVTIENGDTIYFNGNFIQCNRAWRITKERIGVKENA